MSHYAPYIQQAASPAVDETHMQAIIKHLAQLKVYTDCLREGDKQGSDKHTVAIARRYLWEGNVVEPHGNVDQDRLIAARQNYDKHLKQEWNKRAAIARQLPDTATRDHLINTAAQDHARADHGAFIQELLRKPANASVTPFQHASSVKSGVTLLSYVLKKEIGRGSGTVIYSAVKHKGQDVRFAAVKVATGPSLSSFRKTHVQTIEFIIKEKQIMKSLLDSDFVIKALQIAESPLNVLLTELKPCSLQQFLELGWCRVSEADAKHVWTPENPTSKSFAEPGWFEAIQAALRFNPQGKSRVEALKRRGVPKFRPLQQAVSKNFAAQIFLACQYLHNQKIAWRDLRPCNVVIGAEMQVKVIDFGNAYSFKGYHPQYHRSHAVYDLRAFAHTIFFLETGMGSFYETLTYPEMETAVAYRLQQTQSLEAHLKAILKLIKPFTNGRAGFADADAAMRIHFNIGDGSSQSTVTVLQCEAQKALRQDPFLFG